MKASTRFAVVVLSLIAFVGAFAVPAWAGSSYSIVVSMGDSFASGDGIEPYYGQDSAYKYWNEDWVGHRSSASWEGQLVVGGYKLNTVRAVPELAAVENGGTHTFNYDAWSSDGLWYNVATSETRVIHMCGDELNGQGYLEKTVYKLGTDYGTVSYTARYAPEIKVFDYINRTFGAGSVDYVTIMIGGNDIGFAKVMLKAATSSNNISELLVEAKDTFIGSTRPALESTYRAVSAAAGADAQIIVVGYPLLFDGAKSNVLFSATEYAQIDAFVLWMDAQYADIVAQLKASGMGNIHYVSLVDAFKGHGAYSSDNYISGVVFMDDQAFDDAGELRYISAASIHPNTKGSSVIAAEVQKLIDEIEAAEAPHAPGWAYEGGAYRYYNADGTMLKNGWASYQGVYYYFGADGKLVKNGWGTYKGAYYYLGEDGRVVKNGWGTYEGSYYYLDGNGRVVTNAWRQYKGSYYYFGESGKLVVNDWIVYQGKYYYAGANGKPLVNTSITLGGYVYYFGKDGACTGYRAA